MKTALVPLLAALLAFPALAPAAPSLPAPDGGLAWTNEGSPGGGPVQSLGGPGALLVASHWQGGTYRSTDSGLHWQHVDNFPEVVEADVAWSPVDPLIGFVAGFGGVARTTDGGLTWTHPIVSPASYRIATFPTGEVVVTARDSNWFTDVLVSNDHGATWRDLNAPLPQFTSIYGLAFGRTAEEVVVMSISKLWYTHDDGATWTEQAMTVGLDLARAAEGTLWKATAPLQKSTDGGVTWQDADTPGESNPHTLGVGHGRVYAASAEGLVMTADGGATWEVLGFPEVGFAATSVVPDPADPLAVFITHESLSILRAKQTATGWVLESRTAGLPPVEVRALGQSHDGALLLAGGPLGLWASRDGGASWAHTGAAMGLQVVYAAAGNSDGTVAYAGGQNAIFQNFLVISRDGGQTFTGMSFDMAGDARVVGIATHPTLPGTAWVAVMSDLGVSRAFETTDAGVTWTEALASEPRIQGIAYHAPSGSLLVATELGVQARDVGGVFLPRTAENARAVASGGALAVAGGQGRVWRALPLDVTVVLLPWATGVQPSHLAASPDGSAAWAAAGGKLHRCAGEAGACQDVSPPSTVVGSMVRADGAVVMAAGPQGVWRAEL